MQWYYNILARRPYLMVLFITVFCTACIIVSLTTNTLPDFTDPTLGFETRGTDIGKRLIAWHNLIQETGPSNLLVANPSDLQHQAERNEYGINDYHHSIGRKNRRNRKRKNRKQRKNQRQRSRNKTELANEIITFKNRLRPKAKNHSAPNEGAERYNASAGMSWHGDNGVFKDYEITNDTSSSLASSSVSSNTSRSNEHGIYGLNMTFVDEDDHRERIQTKKSTWIILQRAELPSASDSGESIRLPIEGYFCDSPAKEYSHFVVERVGPNATDSLFDINGILAMCVLQDQITKVPYYEEYCEREMISNNCCRPWSLANYATLLANKSSCFDLTHEDILLLQNLLLTCFEYFHDLKLSNDCSERKCFAPPECTRKNIVFNILHYLTDYNIIKVNETNIFLKFSMIFVPVSHARKILPLFHEWEKVDLSNELVRVAAMDLGLENELFNELLLTDVWLVALGGIFVMTCMWLYTTSLFVTIMTCIAVIFSLGLAYFVYTLVFEMSFFPYMNLLAVVVIIGIGADDAFIFVKIWQCVLTERFSKTSTITTKSLANPEPEQTETLQNLMALTLKHAAISMFVTSITTAGAFYASYTSYITAIKCFGIFAGTAVITNYFLMITWLPASISIMERFTSFTTCSKLQIQKLLIMLNKSINSFCTKLELWITTAILNYAPILFTLFGIAGICCGVVVLYKPGLQLPESSHFQLFVSNHPFEVYNSKLKNEFWFEKAMANSENYKMPLRFVWGIQPTDDGDYDNPFAYGNLHYDNNFNVSTKNAQLWLLQFCQNLRKQPFYQLTFGMLLPNCFIENFITLMERMCVNSMDDTDRTPCCDISKFPYEPEVFDICLPQIISSLYATPREYFWPGVAGPKFMASPRLMENTTLSEEMVNNTLDTTMANMTTPPPIVKALVVEFESNVSFSTQYDKVKAFVQEVEYWFENELKSAPVEMQNGWFISDLKFYDVQNTLPSSTLVAICVAMSASLVVLLLVTLNILISLYAVVTVLLTIFVTVAILIMLGWKLNILESVTVSTAIGLAVDFSLHYGIHYRLSPSCERLAATQFSLSRIIGPTAMAAITTGIAGALMLFSSVLPYRQIGIFLLVVMSVSWSYSTFFLMSLLKLFGPQYGFMQFQYPRVKKRSATNGIKFYERKPNYITAREQLLTPSSSAVGELINSESHELESLTSNSLIKTISGTECSAQSFSLDYEHLLNNKKSANTLASPVPSHQQHHHTHKCPAFRNGTTAQTSSANTTTTALTMALNASSDVDLETESSKPEIIVCRNHLEETRS
ncbi:protein dispatched [Stomoxys calcitrans]|uniref:SSD domain-containing protein n=1 Tax=Stomoxys calcitrans TaxID=35570 RepID=A0A1I8NTV2_STOCA|nr:protein dispatched [Stomoxys calcitrans]XP_059220056.1 protein dispatched [Stomoxys calcitrans]